MGYNQLWAKKGDSSKFAYHLKELEKKGFVKKLKERYGLTIEGVKYSDYLTFESPQPIMVVMVVAKNGDKVFVRSREKYPFKGYTEFCASKVRQNETLEQAAENRLKDRLGVSGNLEYKGIEFLQTKENGKLIMHHHLHIFLATNLNGNPKDGEWINVRNFSPKKPMPHLNQTLKIALDKGFSIASGDIIKEGDEFPKYVGYSFKSYNC